MTSNFLDQASVDWEILIVDDEPSIHQMLELLLTGFSFYDRGLHIHHAQSAKQAREKCEGIKDLAVILLDVVMEGQHSGLDFVSYLRDDLKNETTQVILITGQSGDVPPWELVTKYAINDYRLKTDLTRDVLFISLATTLRLYAQINNLSNMATHDPLTGLANRNLFNTMLENELRHTRREKGLGALLIIDLDYFKKVNDTYGHLVGDQLLIEIARRFLTVVRSHELVARIGGDEMALVTPSLQNEKSAHKVAERLLKTCEKPFYIEGLTITQDFSIGISLFDAKNNDFLETYKRADKALYEAKSSGRHTYRLL